VGHIWSFAGLNPTAKWLKGQKRPWNASLKTLLWKLGESFVKVSNRENDIYGHIYRTRKDLEWLRNLNGDYAAQATASLEARNFGTDTVARAWYEGRISPSLVKVEYIDKGETIPMTLKKTEVGDERPMLPPARIHLRAERYAVKLLLSHLHEIWFWHEFKKLPPLPYPLVHLGHAHMIAVPFGELFPGYIEARTAFNAMPKPPHNPGYKAT
jgi:hypothetical protein